MNKTIFKSNLLWRTVSFNFEFRFKKNQYSSVINICNKTDNITTTASSITFIALQNETKKCRQQYSKKY